MINYPFYYTIIKEEMNTLKFYIEQLMPKRFELYSKSWWEIGFILFKYNKTDVEDEGYDLWLNKTISSNIYDSDSDSEGKCKRACKQKWSSFQKSKCFTNLSQIVRYVYADGGTIYNPDHKKMIHDADVRNFVYKNIVPKLSIRRTRNMKELVNLCSALYYMSSGEDRYVLDMVSKRIRDTRLKKEFVVAWDYKKFTVEYGMNNIIEWYNEDESNRRELKYDVINFIKRYTNSDTLWLEQTTKHLKSVGIKIK